MNQMNDADTLVETKTVTKLQKPKLWTVVFHNDDFTPMDFVTNILMHVFSLNEAEAENIMITVHERGKANVGLYSKEVAETKSLEVGTFAQKFGFPLKTTIEEQ